LRVVGLLDRGPLPVVETGGRPARLLETRAVGLAVVDLGHQDRSRRGLPALVRADDLLATVLVAHLDLAEKPERLPVEGAAAFPGQLSAVPAVAEDDAHGVVARLQ